MRKVKAFTLLEMTIVLVITSFVFGAGYMAYTSSVRRLKLFEFTVSKNVDIAQLSMLLKQDIDQSISISLPDAARLSIIKINGKETIYFLNPENVVRQSDSQTDTFNVSVSSVSGNPLPFAPKYITMLSILTGTGTDTVRLDYEKIYSPFFMLNYDNL